MGSEAAMEVLVKVRSPWFALVLALVGLAALALAVCAWLLTGGR